MVWHKYGITNRSHGVSLNSNAAGTLAVGASLDTPADPLSSESPLFSQAQTYFRNGVHISVKMRRIEMTLCQKDIKLFSASIGRKQSASKLNTWVHFEDYQKIISMYRKLSLRTCDARWRSQPRPPSQEHKPVSAQLFWLWKYKRHTRNQVPSGQIQLVGDTECHLKNTEVLLAFLVCLPLLDFFLLDLA